MYVGNFTPTITSQRSDLRLASMIGTSCITFGSPPVIRPTIPLEPWSSRGKTFVLNIINEFDIVTRADSDYIRSLVNLYRSIYQMSPMRKANASDNGMLEDTRLTAANHHNSNSERTGGFWPTPSAIYRYIGERVVLHTHMCDENSSGESDISVTDEFELKVYKVEAQDFQKLLFCRISAHK